MISINMIILGKLFDAHFLGAILMSNYLCLSVYFFEIMNQQSTYFLIAGVSLFVSNCTFDSRSSFMTTFPLSRL